MYVIFLLLLFFINVSSGFVSLQGFTNYMSKLIGENDEAAYYPGQLSSIHKKNLCDENRLMVHLAKLYAISPERVVSLVASDSLIDACRDVSQTLIKIDQDFKNCDALPSTNLFMKLLQSLKVFDKDICQPNEKCKKLIRNQDCLKELHEEYLDCEGPADWFERTNKSIVCQIFTDILNCNYIKTAELCGYDVAVILRTFSIYIFEPVLPSKCKVPGSLPKVKNPMPSVRSGKNYKASNWLLYIFFILHFIKNCT